MSYQNDRDEFFAILARELPDTPAHQIAHLGRSLCRSAQTLHRLAVAECNGTYPYGFGSGNTIPLPPMLACDRCETEIFKMALNKHGRCQECVTRSQTIALLLPFKIGAVFGGDPRGCVLKIKFPSGVSNDWGREGICVPVRER